VNMAKTNRTGFVLSTNSSIVVDPVLRCSQCRELDRMLRRKLAKYAEACASPFYRVTKELAARSQVNMERARNDLKEHLLICTDRAAVA